MAGGAIITHSLSGSVFAGMGEQVPVKWPPRLQLSHVPTHALSQQTPSLQKVEVHSLPAVHRVPSNASVSPL